MHITHETTDAAFLFAASFAFCRAYGVLSLDFGRHSFNLYLYKR